MSLYDQILKRTQPIVIWRGRDKRCVVDAESFLAKARSIAQQIHTIGINRSNVVVLMMPTGIELLCCIVATWGCGATICIVPHSIGGQPGKLNSLRLKGILEVLSPSLIIHDEQVQFENIQTAEITLLSRSDLVFDSGAKYFPSFPTEEDYALIQLTSGSTNLPKGVPITHFALNNNLAAITRRAAVDHSDHMCSWLPLYHDMGLSALTVALYNNLPLTLLPTETFVQLPTNWLEALSIQKATLSPNPNFAFGLLSRFGKRLERLNIDLSNWRYGWVGGEPVNYDSLASFCQTMAPFGMKPNVLKPSYGLAEAVVAVSGAGPHQALKSIIVDRNLLWQSSRVKLLPSMTAEAVRLTSNGPTLDDILISIRRANGVVADQDEQGHIWLSGPSILTNYIGEVDHHLFEDGWFDTGDLGFLHQGELYISGRSKDTIIRGGVNISVAHLEWVVEEHMDLRPGQVAAFSYQVPGQSLEQICIMVGSKPGDELQRKLTVDITKALLAETGVHVDRVVFVSSGQIPKTTSGKIQRAVARNLLTSGAIGGTL